MPDLLAGAFSEASGEVFHEQWNIFRPLAERRNRDRKYVQPVEKILAKNSGGDGGREIPIGCGNQADVYRDRMIAPHALEFALLEHTQKRDLRFHREFADFIQEE